MFNQGITPPRNRQSKGQSPPSKGRLLEDQWKYQIAKLKDQIKHLRRYIDKREKEHEGQMDQLRRQNKHFTNHIRKLQEEVAKAEGWKTKLSNQQNNLIELRQYVQSVGGEIRKRQEREIKLLHQNKQLGSVIEALRNQIQDMGADSDQLRRQLQFLREVEQELRNLKQRHKEIKQSKPVCSPLPEVSLAETKNIRANNTLERLEKDILKLIQQNEELRKDCQCLLGLLDERV